MKVSAKRNQPASWVNPFLGLLVAAALLLGVLPADALGAPTPANGQISIDLPMANTPDLSLPLAEALALPGYALNVLPGEPRLPVRTLQVLLPPDAVAGSVSVTFTPGAWADLPGTHDVPASPPLLSDDGAALEDWNGAAEADLDQGRLIDIYASDAFWPAEPVQILSVGDQRGFRVLTVAYWPLAYNPIQGMLRQWGDATLTVSYDKRAQGAAPRDAASAQTWDMLGPEIANAGDRQVLYDVSALAVESGIVLDDASPMATNDYVVITTNAIRNNSAQLAAFVECKELAGHTVKVVTEGTSATSTTYIAGTTADARANNIRAWLKSRYLSESILYVLLIGNPHPTTFDAATSVPMKMTLPNSGYTTPTDMFYSDLSGTWDLNNNGTYGELADIGTGGIDRLPEVTVGRVPYYNSYADLDAILARFITYSSATGDLSWRQRALIAAAISNHGPQDNNNDGTADYVTSQRTYGDDWGQAIKSMLGASGIGAYTLYEKTGVYSDGSAYPTTAANAGLTTENLINAWKNGYGLVTWWGHGNYSGAYRRVWGNDSTRGDRITQYPQETTSPRFFYSGDTFQLNNVRPSFVVQVSCQNGQPEYLDNLGYRLLVNGAVGTVSSSRLSWYVMGPWAPQDGAGWADNASMGYRVLQRMGVNGESMGEALAYFRAYSGYFGSGGLWMNLVGANLYGDPSLSLDSAGDPCQVAPSTPEVLSPADGSLSIDIDADLTWAGGHTCLTESVTYDVYMGTNGTASTLVCSGPDMACDPGALLNGTTYSWQVVASSAGGTSTSPLWDFRTEEVPCSVPPSVPSDPTPLDGLTGISPYTNLTWCGGSSCPGGIVQYDVLMREKGAPSFSAVCTLLDTASCTPGKLKEDTEYEWKVVAWDVLSLASGGIVEGPTWSFVTRQPLDLNYQLYMPITFRP
ncbi:MAG: C25 family cysteine peptidase [Anaerolineae bacterium]